MNKERKVVEYRRKLDGIYEPIEMEPSMPRPCEGSENKSLRELAVYGKRIRRWKTMECWVEHTLVPAGIYTVGTEIVTIPETKIIITKSRAFLFKLQLFG